MNIIELQERLKDLPENALMQEMQMPSGTAPQFLVLSELKRRKRMRDEYQRQQAQGMQTVAEEAVTGAGAPAEGIMQMSRAMAPQSAIAQNTGVNDMMQQQSVRAPQPEQPMMMADGGYVRRMQEGGRTEEPGAMRRLLENIKERIRAGRMSDEEARWLIENYRMLPEELSPVDAAIDTVRSFESGDYPGAAINAASTLPLGRFVGPAMNVAAELYNRAGDRELEPVDEFPVGMADGGYVQRMRDGGFGQNVEYDYAAFLQEMGLSDTPDARDAFRRYQERMNTRSALDGPNADPALFGPESQRMLLQDIRGDRYAGPGQPSIGDVSADVGAFLPGAGAAPSMMGMPPAMMEPSAGAVDFDASVTDDPVLDPLRNYLATFQGDTGASQPAPSAPAVADVPEAAVERESDGVYTDALRDYLSGFRGDRGLSRPFEADPLDPRSPGYTPPSSGFDIANLTPEQREEYEGLTPEQQENIRMFGVTGIERQTPDLPQVEFVQPDPLPAPSMTIPERLQQYEEFEQQGPNIADLLAGRPGMSFGDGLQVPEGGIMELLAPPSQEAARSAEAARMMEINELPDATRRVTDTGEIIPPANALSDARTGGGGTGGTGGGSGGSAGGGADFGPIESRIARMLEERERSAQADKWLSLAQTGLALMASDQPTLGGAIGEAGLAGIGAMQKARSQYDKDIMELLDMQAGVQRARAAGARAGEPRARTAAELNSALDFFEGEVERLATPIYGPDPSDPIGMKQTIVGYDYSSVPPDVMNNYTRLRDQYLQMFQSPVDVTS